jgi:WD40 repeat protein
MKKIFFLGLALLCSGLLLGEENVSAPWKYALVIGNGAYQKTRPLANTVNDAVDIAAALHDLGFEVDLRRDAVIRDMIGAVNAFTGRLAANRNSEGFFWYAGHAVELKGENLLNAVDVDGESEDYLRLGSYSLTALLGKLDEARNRANVVIIDACRNNPFRDNRGRAIGGGRGLGVINNIPGDLFYMFSTAPGTTASDGEGRRNSPFAEAFLKHINLAEPLVVVAGRITGETLRLTNNAQRPFQGGSIVSDVLYTLGNKPAPPQAKPAALNPAAPPQGPEKLLRMEHSDFVRSAVYSPDGRRVVSASDDKTVKVWDAETGWLIRTLTGHSDGVPSAAYSPDGRRLVSASWDDTIKVWDVETGWLIRTLTGHSGNVVGAAYSPDGRRVVSASADKTVKVWDEETGQLLRTLQGHSGSVVKAAYSPDGRRVVSASYDGTVKIWDTETGQLLHTLPGYPGWVHSAAYSPDGRRVVSASDDKTVKIWDAETGQLLRTLQGHSDKVNSAAYSPDGRRIVSASVDKTVRVWDAETGEQL